MVLFYFLGDTLGGLLLANYFFREESMQVYGLADLHLALGVPNKTMEVFGEPWLDYHSKIERSWREVVAPEDVVLLPGDISWAMDLKEAVVDFSFLDSLPGTKYMIRGNHDYWSSASVSKLMQVLPSSVHYLSKGWEIFFPKHAVVGVRLWDSPCISMGWEGIPQKEYTEQDEKIFLRELGRLQRALEALPADVERVIVMTHYPPISRDGTPGPVSELLEKDSRITHCLFGHLHKVPSPLSGFGNIRGINYQLLSADYVNFVPQGVM